MCKGSCVLSQTKQRYTALIAIFALQLGACSVLIDTTECRTDEDCASFGAGGQQLTCNVSINKCEVAAPECTTNLQCGAGQQCKDNVCQQLPAPDMSQTDPDMGDEQPDMTPSNIIEISGAITQDTVWSSDKLYVLKTIVYVQPQVTLTIQPGTQIHGESASALIVRRGGKLRANGQANAPIVFTSAKAPGQRAPGDWGGIALLGNAKTNEANAVLEGIEDASQVGYGGNDEKWSCGALRYVRVEFAGFALDRNKELNGLTMAGCGSDTLVEYVQIHYGSDDGLEIFGGSVNLKYVAITRAQDDSLDIDRGWTGNAQFIAIQQDDGVDVDNGFEADNWATNNDATPRTSPQLYNVTWIGPLGGGQARGMTLKEGVAGTISNSIVLGHPNEAIDVKGAATVAQLNSDALIVKHTLFYSIGPGKADYFSMESDDDAGFDEQAHFTKAEYNNIFGRNPELADPFNLRAPDLTPTKDTAVSGGAQLPGGTDFFDETAIYLGAFRPGAKSWMDVWTDFPEN